jgi:hypothetical protein
MIITWKLTLLNDMGEELDLSELTGEEVLQVARSIQDDIMSGELEVSE